MKEPQKNGFCSVACATVGYHSSSFVRQVRINTISPVLEFTKAYILLSTKRTLGVATISCSDHGVAQMRELEYTKVVIPAVTEGLIKF